MFTWELKPTLHLLAESISQMGIVSVYRHLSHTQKGVLDFLRIESWLSHQRNQVWEMWVTMETLCFDIRVSRVTKGPSFPKSLEGSCGFSLKWHLRKSSFGQGRSWYQSGMPLPSMGGRFKLVTHSCWHQSSYFRVKVELGHSMASRALLGTPGQAIQGKHDTCPSSHWERQKST